MSLVQTPYYSKNKHQVYFGRMYGYCAEADLCNGMLSGGRRLNFKCHNNAIGRINLVSISNLSKLLCGLLSMVTYRNEQSVAT